MELTLEQATARVTELEGKLSATNGKLSEITKAFETRTAEWSKSEPIVKAAREKVLRQHLDTAYNGALYPEVLTLAPSIELDLTTFEPTQDSLAAAKKWREEHPGFFGSATAQTPGQRSPGASTPGIDPKASEWTGDDWTKMEREDPERFRRLDREYLLWCQKQDRLNKQGVR